MSLPFARSERALRTDDYRTALLVSLLIVPLFVAWLIWFFNSDLPIRQSSQQLAVGKNDTVVANFSLAKQPDLTPGDAAWLRLQLPGGQQPTLIPAIVYDIAPRSNGTYDIYLYPDPKIFTVSSSSTLTGQAEVDVDNRSPFEYLMQKSQLGTNDTQSPAR